MELVVRGVVGHHWNPDGGCTLIVDADLDGTVRDTYEVTLPADVVAAVRRILDRPR